MLIDFKLTYDNAKRNITKTSLGKATARSRMTIINYYTGATEYRQDFSDLVVEIFKKNGDEIFYI